MRQIVLDIEATGISPAEGHRLVEIAAIELKDGVPTGKTYHQYINPQRASDPDALKAHGLTEEFLNQQPLFKDIVGEFLFFVDQTELIIHNAPFDVGFINNELKLAGLGDHTIADRCRIINTLVMARERFPGQRNTLAGLCKRFGIELEEGRYEGAMQDVFLLSEVYNKMQEHKLIIDLRSFNIKERYLLLRNIYDKSPESISPSDTFQPSENFRIALGKELGIDDIPETAFAAMDYHLNWLAASLKLNVDGELLDNQDNSIQGNQEDIDFLLAFQDKISQQCQLIFIEAKGVTAWDPEQLVSKLIRLDEIQKAADKLNVKCHFLLMSPAEPTENFLKSFYAFKSKDKDAQEREFLWVMKDNKFSFLKLVMPDWRKATRVKVDGKYSKVKVTNKSGNAR